MRLVARFRALSTTTKTVLIVGALLLIPTLGDIVGPVNHLILVAVELLAATAIWTGSNREVGPWEAERRGWTMIAIGLVAAAASDASYFLSWHSSGSVEFPSPADFIWLLAETVLLVGVLMVPHPRYAGRTRLKLRLDQITGIVAFLALAWIGYFSSLLATDIVSSSLVGEVLAGLFMLVDIVAFVSVLILTTRRGAGHFAPATLALTWAIALTSVGNVATAALAESTGQTSDEFWWIHGFYVLSMSAYLGAADSLQAKGLVRATAVTELPAKVVLAPYAMVAALVVAYTGRLLASVSSRDDAVIQIALLAIAGLVIGRQSVAIGETRAYMERQRDEMVASVSHELRTPLTAVSGFSAMLTSQWDDLDDETKREFVSHIDDHSTQLGRIVQDLIELARNGLEVIDLRPEPVRLAVLVTEAIEVSGIDPDVKRHIIPDVPFDLVVEVDRTRATQIIGNLIANAAKYGRSAVAVSASVDDNWVRISVADDGAGVPEKYVASIFDRFERGVHRYDSSLPGTGLGLPIARALAVAHGGTITVGRSKALGGAEFTFELPRTATTPRFSHSTPPGTLPA